MLFLLQIDFCSEWCEHQIIEQVKNDVMIEENASSLVNLSCLLMNQTSCLNECTTKYKKESISLPLSSLHVLWVEVSFLKVRKPKFSWSGLVAIRSTQYYFHTQMKNALSGLWRAMVRSTIQKEHSLLPPRHSILRGKSLSKLWQEHLHHVFICVALLLGQHNVTFRRTSNDDIHLLSKWPIWHWVDVTGARPAPSSEVWHWNPAFVYVYYVVSFRVELQHLACIKVS